VLQISYWQFSLLGICTSEGQDSTGNVLYAHGAYVNELTACRTDMTIDLIIVYIFSTGILTRYDIHVPLSFSALTDATVGKHHLHAEPALGEYTNLA
jgi:hypothetical protein